MIRDLLKKYLVPIVVGVGVVAMAVGLLCNHPTPIPTGVGGVDSPVPSDTSSTSVTVTDNKVKISDKGKIKELPKHPGSTVIVSNYDPKKPQKPSGGKPLSPSTTIVIGKDDGKMVVTVKDWGFTCRPQLEGGINSNLKPLAGVRAKLFHYHGFGLGVGINTSGFNLVDLSHELPKLTVVDATVGLSHTTFEVKKGLAVKASLAVNLW